MTCNVGGIERPIRILLGLALVAVGASAELPVAGMALVLLAGAIALITGVIGFCPAWALLGVNTCPASLHNGSAG
ncbi:YgaP family membrane protein [Nitrospira sp. Nam80]